MTYKHIQYDKHVLEIREGVVSRENVKQVDHALSLHFTNGHLYNSQYIKFEIEGKQFVFYKVN